MENLERHYLKELLVLNEWADPEDCRSYRGRHSAVIYIIDEEA